MARVPIYEPQVNQAPLPDARVNLRTTPEDFGAGVAQGAEQLGAGLEKLALREKAKQDTARSMDATATMDSYDDLSIYDPQKGALATRKGKDAVGMTDEFTKARDEAVARTREGLGNDEQRVAFDRVQARKREVLQHTLSRHEAEQNDAWAKQQVGAVAETAASNAANAAAAGPIEDPATSKALELARQQTRDAFAAAAQPGGALAGEGDPNDPASPAGRALRGQLTALHLSVLDRLTDQKRIGEAKAYLKAHKGEIDGVALGKAKVNEVLAAGVAADQARAEEDRIWTEAKGDPTTAGELARAIKDTTLFDAVDARLKKRVAEAHALTAAADAPRVGRLEVTLDRSGGLDRLSKDYAALSDEGKARVEAKYLANRRSRRVEGSEERRQQAAIDAQAKFDFDALPLDERIKVDVGEMFPNVSDVGASALKARQRKAAESKAADNGVAENAFKDQVAGVAQVLGYDPKTAGKQFMTFVLDRYQHELEATPGKKTLPPAKVNEVLADSILYGSVPGRLFGTNDTSRFQAGAKPFTPRPEAEQPDKVKAALAKLRAGAAPRAAAPAAAGKVTRTVNGETRVWNGSAWVTE